MTADENFNHETSNPYEGWPDADIAAPVEQETVAHRLATVGRVSEVHNVPIEKIRPRYALPVGGALIGAAFLSVVLSVGGLNLESMPLISHQSNYRIAAPATERPVVAPNKASSSKNKPNAEALSAATPHVIGLEPPASDVAPQAEPTSSPAGPPTGTAAAPIAARNTPTPAATTSKPLVTVPPLKVAVPVVPVPAVPAPVISTPPITTPVAVPLTIVTNSSPLIGDTGLTLDQLRAKYNVTTTTTTQPSLESTPRTITKLPNGQIVISG